MSNCLFSQELIEAKKEPLISIQLGSSSGQIQYYSSEEGFFSVGSPFVDTQGRLIFGATANNARKLIISKRNSQEIDSTKKEIQLIGTPIVSQEGIGVISGKQLVLVGNDYLSIDYHKYHSFFDWNENYPMPFGALLYSETSKAGIAVAFDVKNPTGNFAVINEENLKTWLQTQPGGFSIGEDGLLYRNGVLWSAVKPEKLKSFDYRYLGRLASGHVIWAGGRGAMESEFYIATPGGNIECHLTFPWAPVYGKTEYNPFNYGLGPWGEFYCLIAPLSVKGKNWPPKDSSSELVVVRNHLKYFGRLNDDKVRLRKGPSTATESLGTYPVKTGFRILEKGTAEETIGGQKNVWYKVRLLDGTEGWFFGAFVHNLYDGPDGNPPPWPNVADW